MRIAVPTAVLSLVLSSAALATSPAIKAPAGEYKLDPYHSSLTAKVMHLGLAPYAVRFNRVEATLKLDPAKLANSTLTVTIDPASVETDFSGDYVATHKGTPYKTFDEALAQGDKYFNAGKFPAIAFKSTSVKQGRDGLKVTGDLSFLGQTHPVTLDVTVTGSMEKHPFTQKGAVGFSATGKFTRSQWGMTGTQQFLGDEVTLTFDGEFHQP